MTLEIDVRGDVKEVTRYLTRVQRKQVPFATALALTRTAQDAAKAETAQIPKKLDRPTPFTKKAIGFKAANKHTLISTVFVKDIQAAYLGLQITGGARTAKGKGTGVPTRNKKLNKYGNIAGRRKGLVKGKNQFIATIKGISGVWERTGGKKAGQLKLLVAFEKAVKYRKRFPFYKIAQGVVRAKFTRNFNAALRRALATAR